MLKEERQPKLEVPFSRLNSLERSSDRANVLLKAARLERAPGFLLCSEIRTKPVTLLSALEDVLQRTLASLPGTLQKLEYVSSLRMDGRYAHWGLSRVHGEDCAQRALANAHHMLVTDILRAPLRSLLEDSNVQDGTQPAAAAYLDNLRQRSGNLLPDTPGPGVPRHLSSVLHALSALARSRRHATHLGA